MWQGFVISIAGVSRWDKSCVAGFEKRYHGFVSAFMFATETQQTIGAALQVHAGCCSIKDTPTSPFQCTQRIPPCCIEDMVMHHASVEERTDS